MKRFLMVMACTLIWVAPSYAQTCTGDLSFGAAPLQVGALGAFSSNSHTFAVGAGVGNDLLFGRGAVELMSFSGVDASAHAISGTAGAQFKFEASSKEIAVCPIVQLVHVWGPNIDVDHSTTVFQVGASVGFVAAKTAQATIVPTLALSLDHVSSTLSVDDQVAVEFGPVSSSNGSSGGNLQFGAGIIFSDRYSLVPTIIVPFGFSGGGETVFSVLFAAKI